MSSLTQMLDEWDAGKITETKARRLIDAAFPGFWSHVSKLDHELKKRFGNDAALNLIKFDGRSDFTFFFDVRGTTSKWIAGAYEAPGTAPESRPHVRIGDKRFADVESALDHLTHAVFEIVKN